MTKYQTHKRQSAIALLSQIVASPNGGHDFAQDESEELYSVLDGHNFLWDERQQKWRLRKPGTRGKSRKRDVAKYEIMLIRIIAPRAILDHERENFTLAMEVAGYEVLEISDPKDMRGSTFYRVYLKVKVG